MIIYNPVNWYWVVAEDASQLFSSRRREYVPADDAEYLAWLAPNVLPTRIDSEESLWAVLAEQAPDCLPDDKTPIPSFVSKLGLKRALEELEMWADIKAAIASNPAVQEEWDLAVEIHRNDPMTQFVIALKQFSDHEVDALIVRAHELVRPAPAQL